MGDTITVLRAHGRRLAKVIRADGSIDDYDKARTVDIFEIHVDGLDAVERLLRHLARRRDCCAVRGAIVDPQRVKNVRRLLYREGPDDPTLRDVPRWWLALDFDSLPRPDWIEPTDLTACACVAIETLPPEFRRARFIVQATAGHGLKPGIRIRLWCWLGRPVSTSELKYWLRSAPVDKSIFGAAQVIYTAAPIFVPGSFDPISARMEVMPGDTVVVVPSRLELPKTPMRHRRFEHAEQDAIDRLVRFVERAKDGNRNAALYWAARRAAEQNAGDQRNAALLEAAAVRAGLSAADAAATIRSGLRHE